MTRAEERQMYLSIGICPICHKNAIEPHKRACLECLGRDNDRYHERHEQGIKRPDNTIYKRRKTEEYRSQGLCYRCGKVKADGLCDRCRAKTKMYRDRNRADIDRSERPSYGRCYICGKNELYEDKKVCKSCYDTRLTTVPAMLSVQNHEYFRKLNNLHYKERMAAE